VSAGAHPPPRPGRPGTPGARSGHPERCQAPAPTAGRCLTPNGHGIPLALALSREGERGPPSPCSYGVAPAYAEAAAGESGERRQHPTQSLPAGGRPQSRQERQRIEPIRVGAEHPPYHCSPGASPCIGIMPVSHSRTCASNPPLRQMVRANAACVAPSPFIVSPLQGSGGGNRRCERRSRPFASLMAGL